MKKFYLIIFSLLCFILTDNVYAASAKISVSANKSTVIVGETVTVTVKISSQNALGSWSFDVTPSSNLKLTNSSFGGLYVKDVTSSTSLKSQSYTFTFKATASGTGTVSIKNASIYGYDELPMSVTTGSVGFKMMTQSELQATYSKNNYLKSLSIEGYSFSFNKETLEYNVSVPNDTTSIVVNATKEDNTATVKGTGTISLSEGLNPVKVTVTAQNGSTRTYTINVNVLSLEPIEVELNGNKYTVIRKKDAMPQASIYYADTTILIDEEEVPAYYNEATNFTLIGLKDINGNSKLYIYNDGNYKVYDEYSFNQLAIYMLEMDESILPEGYKIDKININGNSVASYVNESYEYPLVYGLNLETGEKNLYKYDIKENTLQRYETFEVDNIPYPIIIITLVSLLLVTYLFIIINVINNNKKYKKNLDKPNKTQKKEKIEDMAEL